MGIFFKTRTFFSYRIIFSTFFVLRWGFQPWTIARFFVCFCDYVFAPSVIVDTAFFSTSATTVVRNHFVQQQPATRSSKKKITTEPTPRIALLRARNGVDPCDIIILLYRCTVYYVLFSETWDAQIVDKWSAFSSE